MCCKLLLLIQYPGIIVYCNWDDEPGLMHLKTAYTIGALDVAESSSPLLRFLMLLTPSPPPGLLICKRAHDHAVLTSFLTNLLLIFL